MGGMKRLWALSRAREPRTKPDSAKPCAAIQINDEMFCHRCASRWDVGDTKPCEEQQ